MARTPVLTGQQTLCRESLTGSSALRWPALKVLIIIFIAFRGRALPSRHAIATARGVHVRYPCCHLEDAPTRTRTECWAPRKACSIRKIF